MTLILMMMLSDKCNATVHAVGLMALIGRLKA